MRFTEKCRCLPSSEPPTHQLPPLGGLPPSSMWPTSLCGHAFFFHSSTPHALDDELLSKTSERITRSVATWHGCDARLKAAVPTRSSGVPVGLMGTAGRVRSFVDLASTRLASRGSPAA